MNLDEVENGYLYAIKTRPCWLEPFVAIKTDGGLRFVSAAVAGVEISSNGPFEVDENLDDLAQEKGVEFSGQQVCSLWLDRFSENILDEVFAIDSDSDEIIKDGTINWGAKTQKPAEELSNWLRKSDDWPGSSSAVFWDSDGRFSGSFITLFTANPYQLAVLLTWIGVSTDVIKGVTGIDPE